MTEQVIRHTLLVIDDGILDPQSLQKSVVEKFSEKNIELHLTLVLARDGAKGSLKFSNQTFDAVIVNAKVPRMKESGLFQSLSSPKSGFHGPLYVIGGNAEAMSMIPTGKNFALPLDPQKLIEAVIEDLSRPQKPRAPAAASSIYAVDVRVINAIIAATLKVLGQFGMTHIEMGKPVQRALNEPMAGVISSVLEIKSATFRGQLSISFDEPSFLEMVSGMLCEEQTSIHAENQDAVGEINNIIFGNAKSDLTSYGVQLTIPKVVTGAGQLTSCPKLSAALRVPFQTTKGWFYIDLIAYPAA
jgi:chemotaxis protein CheX